MNRGVERRFCIKYEVYFFLHLIANQHTLTHTHIHVRTIIDIVRHRMKYNNHTHILLNIFQFLY